MVKTDQRNDNLLKFPVCGSKVFELNSDLRCPGVKHSIEPLHLNNHVNGALELVVPAKKKKKPPIMKSLLVNGAQLKYII
jgi:hypothetical protein